MAKSCLRLANSKDDISTSIGSPCSGDSTSVAVKSCCTPQSPNIGLFKVNPYGGPKPFELEDANLVKIVTLDASDEECNTLCWKCLGYRLVESSNPSQKVFETEEVFPKWLSKYPTPPDVIGVTRKYDGDIDRPVRQASMDLMRSIPRDFKGGVKSLTAVGFKLWKLAELTPNKTRRAQLCNWLIYYRERLFGKTIEQLREERENEEKISENEDIANLPSEKMYQKLRLD